MVIVYDLELVFHGADIDGKPMRELYFMHMWKLFFYNRVYAVRWQQKSKLVWPGHATLTDQRPTHSSNNGWEILKYLQSTSYDK